MSRSLHRAAFLAAATIALAACGDATKPAPLAPAGVNLHVSTLLTCDFNALRTDARSYVASSTDPIFNLIGDLEFYTNAGNQTAVYSVGLNGLARLAVVRGTADQKKGSNARKGANVAIGFIGCMNVGPIPDELLPNLAKAMDRGGLFEVPGTSPLPSSQTAPVFSRGESPFWAAQPLSGETWSSTASKRFLMYGFKTAFGPPQGNADPLIGPTGFDFRTLPTIGTAADQIVLVKPLVIGSCGLGGVTVRFKHTTQILFDIPPTCPLTAPPFVIASRSAGLLTLPSDLVQSTFAAFAPKPLHAATFFALGRVGGAVSELSPSGAIDVVSAVPRFVSQPTNGVVNQPIPGTRGSVVVQLRSGAGSALEGGIVTIRVGPPSGAAVVTLTATTDHDGFARFPTLQLSAPGTYVILASGDFDGVTGPTVSSVTFVVN